MFKIKLAFYLLLFLSTNLTATVATAQTLQQLQEEYQHYLRLVNNDNVIWLSTPVGDIEGYVFRAGTHNFEEVKQILWNKALVNPSVTYDDYLSSLALLADLSNQTKRRAKEELLPRLKQEIISRGGSVQPESSMSDDSESFSDVMERLNDPDHLDSVSFKNIDSTVNEGTVSDTNTGTFSNPCGRMLSPQEKRNLKDWFHQLEKSWGKANHGNLINLQTRASLSNYIGSSSKRYYDQYKAWEKQVDCFDRCAQSYPQTGATIDDNIRLQNCIKPCRSIKYPQCM